VVDNQLLRCQFAIMTWVLLRAGLPSQSRLTDKSTWRNFPERSIVLSGPQNVVA
jgi:hypothetical protein